MATIGLAATILTALVVAGVLVLVLISLPDIARYLKIREM